MKIAVWDTYVERFDGKRMHFDILVHSTTAEDQVQTYGRQYLDSKPFTTKTLSSKECQFCHMEEGSDQLSEKIRQRGYAIVEMENCI